MFLVSEYVVRDDVMSKSLFLFFKAYQIVQFYNFYVLFAFEKNKNSSKTVSQ